jgi:hypothetical protein
VTPGTVTDGTVIAGSVPGSVTGGTATAGNVTFGAGRSAAEMFGAGVVVVASILGELTTD